MGAYALTAALLLSFASFVTMHVALVYRLVSRQKPRWPGLIALVVVPLAPFLAQRARWTRWTLAWLISLALYVVALAAGHLTR